MLIILKVLSIYCIAVIAIAFIIELKALRDKKIRRAKKTKSPEEQRTIDEFLRKASKSKRRTN